MSDITDDLEKLARLRESGVLTPEEFDSQKARLLGTNSTSAPAHSAPDPAPTRSSSPAPKAQPFLASTRGKVIAIGGAGVLGLAAISAIGRGSHTPYNSPGLISASPSSQSLAPPPGSADSSADPLAPGTPAQVTEAPGATDGAPTQEEVAKLLIGNRDDLTINFVQIGAPHAATAFEASRINADLGQPIFPVHASYTSHNGIHVRDTDSHWYAFRSRVKQGAWDIGDWTLPGDKNNELRP